MSSRQYKLSYKLYGEHGILIEWPSKIDKKLFTDVIFYKNELQKKYIKSFVEIIHTYNSILIFYISGIEDVYGEIIALKSLYNDCLHLSQPQKRLWKVPVCYEKRFAADLEFFAEQKSMNIDEIVTLHITPIYMVYFIGFLPGFMYLGGLDEKLEMPRKVKPSLNVKKGAVAIGGNQTGVYPIDSPGGWHVIGSTPISFFDSKRSKPCFVSPGDYVQFISIKEKEYIDISSRVSNQNYKLDFEYYDR